jgi:hypothetical protein
MAPNIPSAKITLSCPLFAADFDPRNNDFLLVGGGGGEGRSGVGNKIASLYPFFSLCISLIRFPQRSLGSFLLTGYSTNRLSLIPLNGLRSLK